MKRLEDALYLFAQAVLWGLAIGLLSMLLDFGFFHALRLVTAISRWDATAGFYVFGIVLSLMIFNVGWGYGQKRKSVVIHDNIVNPYRSTVEYPHRPLASLSLIIGGALLLLLLAIVAPETLVPLL
jgi:hypothetical protein